MGKSARGSGGSKKLVRDLTDFPEVKSGVQFGLTASPGSGNDTLNLSIDEKIFIDKAGETSRIKPGLYPLTAEHFGYRCPSQ